MLILINGREGDGDRTLTLTAQEALNLSRDLRQVAKEGVEDHDIYQIEIVNTLQNNLNNPFVIRVVSDEELEEGTETEGS